MMQEKSKRLLTKSKIFNKLNRKLKIHIVQFDRRNFDYIECVISFRSVWEFEKYVSYGGKVIKFTIFPLIFLPGTFRGEQFAMILKLIKRYHSFIIHFEIEHDVNHDCASIID